MAMTNAEKVRAYRERQKAAKKAELHQEDATGANKLMRTPFFEAYQRNGNAMNVELALDTAGIELPTFDDDSGPKSVSGEVEGMFESDPDQSPYAKGGGSLARAEIMVGCLIDAASELAGIINTHKRDEIAARIAELEQSDLSDPVTKKKALTDMVRLRKILDQLNKQVRWTFPQWKAQGE
jgi:hypothetical protein